MKVYGLTAIYSCGLDEGKESETLLFFDSEKRLEAAYNKYAEEFDFQVKEGTFEDGKDENDKPKMTYEEFVKESKEKDCLGLIQMPDWHFQIDFFEQEMPKRYSVMNVQSDSDGREALWTKEDFCSLAEAEEFVRNEAAEDFGADPETVEDDYLYMSYTSSEDDTVYHFHNSDGRDEFYIIHQQ